MMNTRIYTYGELQAFSLLTSAGIIPMSTMTEKDSKWAAEYILQLAEKIKNERANAAMELAGNRCFA